MSVIKGKRSPCFFCGKPITGKAVEWIEHNNYAENPEEKGKIRLHLHPQCAIQLGIRLMGDAYTADPKVEELRAIKLWTRTRVGGHIIENEELLINCPKCGHEVVSNPFARGKSSWRRI